MEQQITTLYRLFDTYIMIASTGLDDYYLRAEQVMSQIRLLEDDYNESETIMFTLKLVA